MSEKDKLDGSAVLFALLNRVELRINAPHGNRIRITAFSSKPPFVRSVKILPVSALSGEIDYAIRELVKEVLEGK